VTSVDGAAQRVILRGGRVIVGDGHTVLDDATVVVEHGRITTVDTGDAPASRPGDRHVDVSGKTVMPAVVNPHGHVGYMRGSTTTAENFSRASVLDYMRRILYAGVATFQSLGTDRDDVEIGLRDQQRSGELADEGPLARFYSAGVGIVAPTPGSPNGGPFFSTESMFEASTPDDARAHVRVLAEKRADIVKFWIDDRHGTKSKLPPEVYRAIVDEAHRLGLKAAAHIYTVDDAKAAVRAGADVLAHLPRTGPDRELIDLMLEHDVAAFTSLSIQRPDGTGWLDDPLVIETVTPQTREYLRTRIESIAPQPLFDTVEAYRRMVDAVHQYVEAGVRIVFSADTGLLTQVPGIAEHRELEAMVDAGVSTAETIHAATDRAAEFLSLDSGSVTEGRRADLLVLDADPLTDIRAVRRIDSLYLDGDLVDRAALRDRFLDF